MRRMLLTGFAGTGKTEELVKRAAAAQEAGKDAVLLAFTNRAVQVLRRRVEKMGVEVPAQTIHSRCMAPSKNRALAKARAKWESWTAETQAVNAELSGMSAPPADATERAAWADACVEAMAEGSPQFTAAEAARADWCGIDEASMTPADLLGVVAREVAPSEMVVCGDPGQLPPVEGASALDPSDYDEHDHLTVCHRTDNDELLALAAHVRDGGRLPPTAKVWGYDPAACERADLVLCYTNKTRKRIIADVRELKGYSPAALYAGEPLVCEHSPREWALADRLHKADDVVVVDDAEIEHAHVVNAGRYEPQTEPIYHVWVRRAGVDDQMPMRADGFGADANNGQWRSPVVRVKSWTGDAVETPLPKMDWGYARTIHKAQGGEAPKVVVVLDFGWVRRRRGGEELWRQLAYTAITRVSGALGVCLMAPPRG